MNTSFFLFNPDDGKLARGNVAHRAGLAALVLGLALCPAWAQYPGRIDTAKHKAPTPRAIAVLEWIGQPGKPSASRIIPVAVFDGEAYQPAGLYLPRPEPLAVEPGTEYVLEQGGIAKGLFDVYSAQDLQGYWFGYGAWKQLPPPPPVRKLPPAKVLPRVEDDTDSDRPHFVRRAGGESNSPGASTPAPSPGSQSGASAPASGQASGQSAPPPADPDRPVLRRRPDDGSGTATDPASSATVRGPDFLPSGPETPLGGADPDRPRLTRGAQNPTDKDFTATKLSGNPSDLEQMVAVSDASDHDPRTFTYYWADSGDASQMQARMETLAQQAIAAAEAPPKPVQARRAAPSGPAARARKAPAAPALPTLSDERFHAYALTEGGPATLIFSAQAARPAGGIEYVTLVAQPDLYGELKVIFKTVTDDSHLEATPRMRLVDAVDANANGRGDLLFEVRGKADRQFVLYQIVGDRVDQVFTTGSLPSSPS